MFATSDASNKGDPKDSKCVGSHTIQWMGGSIAHWSGKLPRIGAGSGATEFMALRIATNHSTCKTPKISVHCF